MAERTSVEIPLELSKAETRRFLHYNRFAVLQCGSVLYVCVALVSDTQMPLFTYAFSVDKEQLKKDGSRSLAEYLGKSEKLLPAAPPQRYTPPDLPDTADAARVLNACHSDGVGELSISNFCMHLALAGPAGRAPTSIPAHRLAVLMAPVSVHLSLIRAMLEEVA